MNIIMQYFIVLDKLILTKYDVLKHLIKLRILNRLHPLNNVL